MNEIVEKSVETTNNLGTTDKHPSESKKEQFTNKLNVPFRKFTYASEYFILSILLINAFKNNEISGRKIYFHLY